MSLVDGGSAPVRNGRSKAADTVYYEGADHGEVPHVVKFSGGQSSGMLLFMLLENGLLRAERGDVVIFNNTSAEHPKTYRFAERCKGLVEERYGIPFFWLEFQTYEDARSGEWSRLPTYRLVRSRPRSAKVRDGYCWKGEVFEEMLSWTGYVPNQFRRTCTKALKLETTRRFLRDWFAGKEEIPRQGHHGRESRMTDSAIFERHTRNRGGVPRDILLGKKRYLREQRVHRPAQRFADYSPAFRPFDNPTLPAHSNGSALPDADDVTEYVALIGLRSDEMHRVVRVKGRNSGSEPVSGNEGEYIYAPLAEIGIDREAVDGFWDRQSWGLNWERGTSLSNCVYCFLKGTGNLRRVHAVVDKRLAPKYQNTPSDIGWWVNMERVYGRDLIAEERPITGSSPSGFIGFFGSNGFTYERLLANGANAGGPPGSDDGSLPCDCTD